MKHAFLLQNGSTFEDAVEALDKGGIGFLAFVDENKKLQGIITDGDIRRALLKKQYSIDSMLNRTPVVMLADTPEREIIARLKSLHRRHMPLVDEQGCFVRVFLLDDFKVLSRENVVVVMAGGLGSRLGELTKETPKPMLNIGKRPMLEHVVNMFSEYGFRRFVFCVNYKKEVIKSHFGNGEAFGIDIQYVEEQERLGTAGALSLAEDYLHQDFFVINADVIVNLELDEMLASHKESKALATMCVRRYSHQIPYGVIRVNDDHQITAIEEKPDVEFDINAGVYLLNPKCLQFIDGPTYLDMPTLFERVIASENTANVYRIEDYWFDVGRKEDLYAVDEALSIKE